MTQDKKTNHLTPQVEDLTVAPQIFIESQLCALHWQVLGDTGMDGWGRTVM